VNSLFWLRSIDFASVYIIVLLDYVVFSVFYFVITYPLETEFDFWMGWNNF